MHFTGLVHVYFSTIFGDVLHLTLRTWSLLLTPQLAACSVFTSVQRTSHSVQPESRKTHPSPKATKDTRVNLTQGQPVPLSR